MIFAPMAYAVEVTSLENLENLDEATKSIFL
jgi:hypothetical protein